MLCNIYNTWRQREKNLFSINFNNFCFCESPGYKWCVVRWCFWCCLRCCIAYNVLYFRVCLCYIGSLMFGTMLLFTVPKRCCAWWCCRSIITVKCILFSCDYGVFDEVFPTFWLMFVLKIHKEREQYEILVYYIHIFNIYIRF